MKSFKYLKKFLTIKEINKKVKEQIPLKDNENESEYYLTLIIKSLVNILENSSKNVNLEFPSKQEINISSIITYLNQFKEKVYYDDKISPIIDFINSHYLLSKKEKSFLPVIKDINECVRKEKKLTNSQIDRINYMVIFNFEKFLNFEEKFDFFPHLIDIISKIKENEYNHLFEYYSIIQLFSIYLHNFDNIEKEKFLNIISNILPILFNIITKSKDNNIIEFAFILFCEFFSKNKEQIFEFNPSDKWSFLILKLFKEQIFMFNLNSEDNNFINFIKPFHNKFSLNELERNKKRNPYLSQILLEPNDDNLSKDIKILLPENDQEVTEYLNNKIYEKFPKELHLPKGPFNAFYKYILKYNENFFLNQGQFNKDFIKKKTNVIRGALEITNQILKKNYLELDNNHKYFAAKITGELVKLLFSNLNEKHIIKKCLFCLSSILLIYPEKIIVYFPLIFKAIQIFINKNYEKYIFPLNNFLQNCSKVIKKAYEEHNVKLINEFNKISENKDFHQYLYSVIVIISKSKIINVISKSEENNNVHDLENKSFIFFATFLNNYFLNHIILPVNIEASLIHIILKNPKLYLRKYLIKIICKIFNENVLRNIYKNILTSDQNFLNYKELFFIFRLLCKGKMKNYLNFFVTFLEKNIDIKLHSSTEILKYIDSHIIFYENKFYFTNFDKDDENNNYDVEDVEIYNILYPNNNLKLLNYIVGIITKSMSISSNLKDIIYINKFFKMIFFNLVKIDLKYIQSLMNFLMLYLVNLENYIESEGFEETQNILKKCYEILYYTNSFINIKENQDVYINKINSEYLIKFYSVIIFGLFKLFPDNITSKDYDFLNIIPVINLYLFYFYDSYSANSDNDMTNKEVNSEILLYLESAVKNNFSLSKFKNKNHYNSIHLPIFYFYSFLKNIDETSYFDFIYNYLIKFLNLEEFKFDNSNPYAYINSLNFILFNLFLKIMFKNEKFNQNIKLILSKNQNDLLSLFEKRSLFVDKIYNTIKEKFDNINKIKDVPEEKNRDNKKEIKILSEKNDLIIKSLKFSNKTNFIDVPFIQREFNDTNKNENNNVMMVKSEKEKIEIKLKENNKELNSNYQFWLLYLTKLVSLNKTKRGRTEEKIKKFDDLLKSAFSFYDNKLQKNIIIIKSGEINDKDAELFFPFLSKLGNIITSDNNFSIIKENYFENYVFDFFQKEFNDMSIVLIKENFQQYENLVFNNKLIIYIKPLNSKGVYSIKIQKIPDNNINNIKNNNKNNKIKILTQIDNDINKMFSDYIIIDFNDDKQIDYFFGIMDFLFNYSLLEQFINVPMKMSVK